MTQKFTALMKITAFFLIVLSGCKGMGSNKGKASFTIKNFKGVDSIIIDGKAVPSGGLKMSTTIADSLETIEKEFDTKTPVTQTFTYDVQPGDVVNVDIQVAGEPVSYFLEAGDKIEVEMDDKGAIQKSTFNGDSLHPALIYVNKPLPAYHTGMLKLYLKDGEGFDQQGYDSTFKLSFIPAVKERVSEIDKLFADKKITETMHYALTKYADYVLRSMWYIEANDFKWEDRSMGIGLYRAMPMYVIHERKILDLFNPIQPEQLSKAFDDVLKDSSYPPKSKNMMLRTLIGEMGKFAPDIIKTSIAKIPDEAVRKLYDSYYTKQYLLDLNQYKNDEANINLINFEREKGISTFKQLLDKHKGKVLYIDFWASWCGPCRGEMPASHKLSEELKEQPIVFVYLSTDASYSDWAKAVGEEGFVGNDNSLLIVNTNVSIEFKSWKVDGIPRYMIYDKTGKLVNADAPRPSDNGTKELLLKLAK